MSPASRRLGVIGFVIAIGVQPAAIRAQARDSTAPSRFDPIARRVLTLKLESETLRGRLNAAADGWQPLGWNDSLAAMRTGVDLLAAEARRLQGQGLKLAPQLLTLVERVRIALQTAAHARDQRDARTALAHLSAGLDALEQKIVEGEATRRE